LIGHELKKLNIGREVVGIDASQPMLEEASKKGHYTELEKVFLGDPDEFP
jgi:predicted TPR repeat methyltransferase